MEIIEKKENGVFIAELKGRVDSTNSGELEKILREITDRENSVFLDCSKLEYVSSMGLRVFMIILKKVKGAGGSVVFFAIQEKVQEIFAISGFCDILTCFKDKDEAVEAMKVKK